MDANRMVQTHASDRSPCFIQRHESDCRGCISGAFGGLSTVDIYPAPFVIKNTFVECQVRRNPSLDEFYHERASHSCPNSKLIASGVSVDEEKATLSPISSHLAGMSSPNIWMEDRVFGSSPLFEGQLSFRNTFVHFPVDRPLSLEAFTNDRHAHSCPSSGVGLQGGGILNVDDDFTSCTELDTALPREPVQPPVVLSLADTVPEPTLDVDFSDLPSVGSVGHRSGTCKPCAFTIKGCVSGTSCSYCHMCDPTEKKRRRKEKATVMRGLRNLKNMDPRWILGV